MFSVEQVLYTDILVSMKGIYVRHSVPCQFECLRPMQCSVYGCAKVDTIAGERHDQEPDHYLCPEDITCESPEACDIVGLCRKQLMHPTQTMWYKRIQRLREIIDDYQIWLFSDDVSDHCIVDQWLRCRTEPNSNEKLRMLCAEKWLKYVARQKGIEAARAWFIGNNFDGFPAYVALRDDYYYVLEESAKEFVESVNI